jgi:glucose/arabinose dehydrogenase
MRTPHRDGLQPRKSTGLLGRSTSLILLAAVAVLGAGCGGDEDAAAPTGTTSPPAGGIGLTEVVDGLDSPIQTVPLSADGDRLWILEQAGRIRLVEQGRLRPEPVLDISGRVRSGGEQGLLSLALHPRFADNNLVYIHLSDRNGDTRVEEHRAEPGRIDPEPVRVLLGVDQPYANHNGGSLAFGPDGRLYLGLGDGGSANDPEERAQNLDSRLGKLLRLDVDSPSADWEVAAYGLRNPWRFAFDPATGDAWIGDVGQNAWEEVSVFPSGAGLVNFGWDVYEGRDESSADDRAALNDAGTLRAPVVQYSHDEGCSITGGVVVRGGRVSRLRDRYIYGDYCSGTVWTVSAGEPREPRREGVTVEDLVSIDAAPDGTVFLTSLSGSVERVVTGR